MPDRVFIPLLGIGTLSLTRAEYEAALIPIERPIAPVFKPIHGPREARSITAPASSRGPDPKLRYIRLREVCMRAGLRPSTIYRLISQKKFPEQINLSDRAVARVESDIEAYMEACVIQRDVKGPSKRPIESPYLRMGELMKLTGLNSSSIYELVRKGEFPKWAHLPKIASGWLTAEIDMWIASRHDKLVNRK